ncbi:MAG: Mrp/NBP35 family ATP-binding protein [Sphaerochaetaceae bacterium]
MSEQCDKNCDSCTDDCPDRKKEETDFHVQPKESSKIKHVIGIVSGKGGVGKSLVTSLLAVAMNRRGYKTAVLDADVTGPSIPKAFGITDKATGDEKEGINPNLSRNGIKIMSINLLLEDETAPVVWRGPLIASAVKQFWSDVLWGEVDYMFVDMPPGTGDVPLTVFQSLPIEGVVIVTSPQELVSMIVAKAARMAEMMNIPILGLVENMSYFTCPDNNKNYNIFGESHIEEIAGTHHLPILAKVPIDPAISKACDTGSIESYEGAWLDSVANILEKMEK